MALVNAWAESALKWFGERIGHALGALLHQLLTFVMGLIDAMGSYLLGAYWARLQWAVMGLAVAGILTVLGSALSFLLWFLRRVWSYTSYLYLTVRDFCKGSKTEHDVKVALEGKPTAALA